MKITQVRAHEILASGGLPSIEAEVTLENGIVGSASVPYGASAGSHEATVLIDNDASRYGGNGMLQAIKNVQDKIGPVVIGRDAFDQRGLDQAMIEQGLIKEQERFQAYLHERPSVKEARGWLERLDLERIEATEYPLEVATRAGREFLYHPLLRGGFLDDVYECFEDQTLADQFMTDIAQTITQFTPLIAQRCVLSGWRKS